MTSFFWRERGDYVSFVLYQTFYGISLCPPNLHGKDFHVFQRHRPMVSEKLENVLDVRCRHVALVNVDIPRLSLRVEGGSWRIVPVSVG
jgi:hypothetical protein